MRQVSTPRLVFQAVLVVVGVVISLYLVYLLRQPIGWVAIAGVLALALATPVHLLSQRMRRGFAIALVYLAMLAVPFALGSMIVPPLVTEGNKLAENAPDYAGDVTEFVNDNEQLREINEDYDVTERIREEAGKLPGRLGGAASTLRDVGVGIVNSIFALVTILILTAFMLGGGRRWIDAGLRYLPPERAERIDRVLGRSASAVGNYVAGALAQATIAGVLSYAVLSILGVPFAAPLAVIIFFLDLIPLIGATIGAVIVGVVTLFTNFPTATIVWIIWSIVYQQVENNLIQPQIQRRAVDINPFLVVVAVLFGSTLLGILGALVAVPIAASLQIAMREYAEYRGIRPRAAPVPQPESPSDPPDEPPSEPPPASGEKRRLRRRKGSSGQGEDPAPA